MRTTIDLPEELINEAMAVTNYKTKTALIKAALKNIILREKVKGLKNYYGKVPLEIDLDQVRER
jgi:Arc/MetJ family transcription regulator